MGTRFFCSCHWTLFMFWHFKLEVCVPELVLNETRQDETGTHFRNWRYRDKTTVFWSRHSRKLGKNPGNKRDGTGLLNTARESLEKYRILRLFPENLYKQIDILVWQKGRGGLEKVKICVTSFMNKGKWLNGGLYELR